MKILAIESSCDETAAAVVENGRCVLSSVVATQVEEHKLYGGVVPEIASRRHSEAIVGVVREALERAELTVNDLDAIGVTYAPGLIGALLVGVNFAKGLSLSANLPLIPVHHLRSHIASNYITNPELKPPFLCLVVSGGHTHIIEVTDYTKLRILGKTRDDAAGEAFDKAARAMGWFLVAMVDVLERMDEQMYYEYRAIMAMFKEAVEAMIQFQDAETGMFWQVIDKAGVPGNYLETSGSSLFAYAVLKGVRLGYLPKRFRAYGEKAFYGTCDKYLGVNDKGELQLSGICLVAGLGGATRRDGSLEYYFSEPVVENDAKGVAPLLLAYTEMIIQ